VKLAGARRGAVESWTAGILERGKARRANACIACGATPIRACYVGDAERGPIGCYWCRSCNALAFGSDSFIANLSKHQLEQLSPVGAKAATAKPAQGKLL